MGIPVENNPSESETENISLGQGTLSQSNSEDPLEACLAHFGCDIDIDESIEQVNALLDSTPIMSIDKWQAKEISPPLFVSPPLTSLMEPPKFGLEILSSAHEIEILEPTKGVPIDIEILRHDDKKEKETIVDDYIDEGGVECYFIFRLDLLLPTPKFCLRHRYSNKYSHGMLILPLFLLNT